MAKAKARDDELVTGPELAARLGLTATPVSRLAAGGKLVKEGRGRFWAWASARAYIKSVTESASARQSPAALARAESLKFQVARARLQYDQERRKLIDRAQTEKAIEIVHTALRREIMAVPERIGQEMGFDREGIVRFDELMREALTALATSDPVEILERARR